MPFEGSAGKKVPRAERREAREPPLMGKRVSPGVIGAFVIASFAILLVALIVVGSGKMFRRPVRFVCMFQGNLSGLKVGAPVKVRGVQIGEVSAIKLRLKPSQGKLRPGIQGLRGLHRR
jgi:ABC-type transporter Mla subunit MlaD